ncbi:hypothetical protein EVAR_94347_1 [Eumeta japonica]|uniref:Uncharacterized protein n=1 Tax=Eumeta variegata TaxID=151549 RepID=A0A4C1TPV4_EUMVA|nr:hypothetical protein EVAR_94347_1 [Eumeta japonica]
MPPRLLQPEQPPQPQEHLSPQAAGAHDLDRARTPRAHAARALRRALLPAQLTPAAPRRRRSRPAAAGLAAPAPAPAHLPS